jgi:hypothetical protein
MSVSKLLISALFIYLSKSDKLGFVFELVRHGARAPTINDPMFEVPTGDLT